MREVIVKTSSIEGLGVFAAQGIASGERIRQIRVIREITPEAPLRPELGERPDHCDYPDGSTVLLDFPDRHLNHSCDPNAYVQYVSKIGFLTARRDIPVGSEITIDYNVNISGGTAWPCHCGAARCLGTVVGDFFALPTNLQCEYLPLLADWFLNQHRHRLIALGFFPH